jgi:glycosyltransferase involved in cell wall biosynthesis
MAASPRVTVVMPCFGCAEFVATAVASVRAQSIDFWELIVVIDGSPDESAERARAAAGGDDRIRVLERPHQGVAAARNAGLHAADARARYVTFLDADDALEPTMLDRLSGCLEEHPATPAVHCRATLVDEQGRPLDDAIDLGQRLVASGLGVRMLRDDEPTPFESVLALAWIVPSLVMIRRSTLDAVGGFDEEFGQGFEDTDLMLRLALHGPLGFVPERLVRYCQHAGGSSSVPGRHERQIRKLHDRWRKVGERTPAEAAQIARAWRFHDRQVTLVRAWRMASRRLRRRQPVSALRCVLGGVRIALRSMVSSPAP